MEIIIVYINKILFEILNIANELRDLLSVDNFNLKIFTIYFSLIFVSSVLSFPIIFICIIKFTYLVYLGYYIISNYSYIDLDSLFLI